MLYSKSELSRILTSMNEEVGATELLEQIVKYLDQDVLEDMVKFIDEEVFAESSFFDVTQSEEGEIPFFMDDEENYYDDDEDYFHPTWYEGGDLNGEDY
jgi:hypothetical protein